ncbi:protein YgfX [Pantoea sp. A4]|uniref:protein YgfX n=1 Tax=Pantoea sp. A4 TaxID=1225184 RepID=UPI000382CA74|nr:protein YgfX [Pantoea sp. A4]
MAQWQCNLRLSRRAAWLQRLLFSSLLCSIMAAACSSFWWLLLIPPVVYEGYICSRHRQQYCGILAREDHIYWRWQYKRWQIIHPPRWLPWAVLLQLQNENGKTLRFWLHEDAMTPRDWRTLRAACFSDEL